MNSIELKKYRSNSKVYSLFNHRSALDIRLVKSIGWKVRWIVDLLQIQNQHPWHFAFVLSCKLESGKYSKSKVSRIISRITNSHSVVIIDVNFK